MPFKKPATQSAFTLALCVSILVGVTIYQHQQKDTPTPVDSPIAEISAQQLQRWKQQNLPHQLIDARPDHFYNGWPVGEGIKQGHINGAISFQPNWLDLLDSPEKQRQLLKDKGITQDSPVVIYGNSHTVQPFYQYLKQQGFSKVFLLSGGMKAWSESGYETRQLPLYEKLVHPQWLLEQTAAKTGVKPIILEVGYDEQSAYKDGHIPGAVYLDTQKIEWDQGGTPSWNYIPDKKLLQVLSNYGIAKDTTVIVYADKLAMAAYRAAIALMYAGVTDVRVLNGGKKAWSSQGFDLQTEVNKPEPLSKPSLTSPTNKKLVINIPEAKTLLQKNDSVLASIMTRAEFDGEKSGYLYYQKAGHIPGSTLLESGNTAYDMDNYQDIDGTMRSWTEIETIWANKAITPDIDISFYCGTGWRASEALFAAYLMGWEKISLFDDGWTGWSLDSNNPVSE
ncbi:sulfurtransferase [Endozoicomonas ascidiicola]|uniref:sulfurtransferase n=1 Tax=Endozoicomonas ascidiicola TaxID=1698521 RepID=UPI00082E407D|nr:rhodanese-like domain-containing protein [Endozoicomonas ascidiicola]